MYHIAHLPNNCVSIIQYYSAYFKFLSQKSHSVRLLDINGIKQYNGFVYVDSRPGPAEKQLQSKGMTVGAVKG